MIYKEINKCRISKKNDLVTIFKVNNFGLTGTFPKNKNVKLPKTPLHVVFSKSSKLLQLKPHPSLSSAQLATPPPLTTGLLASTKSSPLPN